MSKLEEGEKGVLRELFDVLLCGRGVQRTRAKSRLLLLAFGNLIRC